MAAKRAKAAEGNARQHLEFEAIRQHGGHLTGPSNGGASSTMSAPTTGSSIAHRRTASSNWLADVDDPQIFEWIHAQGEVGT